MFDLLDLIRKLLSQIIIGVRIIRWFGLMDELRYLCSEELSYYLFSWYLILRTWHWQSIWTDIIIKLRSYQAERPIVYMCIVVGFTVWIILCEHLVTYDLFAHPISLSVQSAIRVYQRVSRPGSRVYRDASTGRQYLLHGLQDPHS